MMIMNQQAYMAILGELLNLYRLADIPALASVPNLEQYEDSFAIMVRVPGYEKSMVTATASSHRNFIAQLS